ncbi:hypothetical protein AB0J72_46690 [Dactylosporangium sp. NPDC049742]|uniref:hypothetical protein n=1 Tax=Dactylosporangium sp. NPDC049742 TaxID=3154737 RepID=UPI003415999C
MLAPGCCAGLENWRDWEGLLSGDLPWLGHAPETRVEVAGESFTLPQGGACVEVPRRALPELLAGVQRNLAGFLDTLGGWAERTGLGARGPALVAAADRGFAITAPLLAAPSERALPRGPHQAVGKR